MAQPRPATFGQASFANQLFGESSRMRSQALTATNQAFAIKDAKMQRALRAMEKFGAALHAREQEKAAKKKSGAGLGAGIGAAAGLGLSLLVPGAGPLFYAAAIGVGTAAGGTIGGAVSPGGANAGGMTAQGAQAIGASITSLSNVYQTFDNSRNYTPPGGGPTVQKGVQVALPDGTSQTVSPGDAPYGGAEDARGFGGAQVNYMPNMKSANAFKAQGVLGEQAADRLRNIGQGVPQPSFQPAAGDIGPPGPGWIKTPDGWVNLFSAGRN